MERFLAKKIDMVEQETITARRLVLVDGSGQPRIVLDATWPNGVATIDLMAPGGAAIKLWMDEHESPKVMVQRKSRPALVFALSDTDDPMLVLYDRTGKPMIRIGQWPEEPGPSVDVYSEGKKTWSSRKTKKPTRKKRA